MPKKCFVPRCKSGYKTCTEKVSLFRVPNSEELLKRWGDSIDRKDRVISRKDHVCEKHFKDEDVIRYWEYRDIKDKLKTPRLKKNAVPCIFPPTNQPEKPNPKPKPKPKPKFSKSEKRERKKRSKNVEPIMKDEIVDDSELDTNLVLYETLDLIEETNLFNQIWNNNVTVTIPSASWALHKVELAGVRTIIVSDVAMTNGVPFYQKQIIMNEDYSVNIIMGDNIISQQDQIKYFGSPVELHTSDELNILINTLHVLNLNGDTNETGFYEIIV